MLGGVGRVPGNGHPYPISPIIPIDVATQIARISSILYQVVVEIHKLATNSLVETGKRHTGLGQIFGPLPIHPFYRCWSKIPTRIRDTIHVAFYVRDVLRLGILQANRIPVVHRFGFHHGLP